MNPLLPLRHFIPDVEARLWADGRIYRYDSRDIADERSYCSHEYGDGPEAAAFRPIARPPRQAAGHVVGRIARPSPREGITSAGSRGAASACA